MFAKGSNALKTKTSKMKTFTPPQTAYTRTVAKAALKDQRMVGQADTALTA